MKSISKKVSCPLMKRDIEVGYCWELCNIASDDILIDGDTIESWETAQKICDECGQFNDDD